MTLVTRRYEVFDFGTPGRVYAITRTGIGVRSALWQEGFQRSSLRYDPSAKRSRMGSVNVTPARQSSAAPVAAGGPLSYACTERVNAPSAVNTDNEFAISGILTSSLWRVNGSQLNYAGSVKLQPGLPSTTAEFTERLGRRAARTTHSRYRHRRRNGSVPLTLAHLSPTRVEETTTAQSSGVRNSRRLARN